LMKFCSNTWKFQRFWSAQKLLGKANTTLERLVSEKPTDAFVQIAATAIIRVEDAARAVDYANRSLGSLSPSNAMDALYAAVYAYYRSLTAVQWSESAAKASTVGVRVSWDRLRDSLNTFIYFARTEAEYLQALGVNVGDVYSALDTASRLVERGTPQSLLRATALTLNTISTLTLTLHRAFSVSVEDSIRAVEGSLNLLLRLAVSEYNATPIVPLLYYEYSVTLTEPESRLAILVEASSYATLLASLSAKPARKPPAGGVNVARTVTETATVTRTETVTTTITETVHETVTTTATRTVATTSTTTKTLVSTVTSTLEKTVTSTSTVARGYTGSTLAASVIASIAVGFALGNLTGRRRRTS